MNEMIIARYATMFQVHGSNPCKKWKKGVGKEVGTQKHVSSKNTDDNANTTYASERNVMNALIV